MTIETLYSLVFYIDSCGLLIFCGFWVLIVCLLDSGCLCLLF